MAEITPAQVHRLLAATHDFTQSTQTAQTARTVLDHALLDVAREAHLGLRDLMALTGLHPSTIRAGIQRAIGPTTIQYHQPELDLDIQATPNGSNPTRTTITAQAAAAPATPCAAALTM
jgi:hypothetical protein